MDGVWRAQGAEALAAESDATCKRNAFVFLAQCAMPKAVEYIVSVFDQILGMDELLQMSIIEVIRLDCKQETSHKVSGPPRTVVDAV